MRFYFLTLCFLLAISVNAQKENNKTTYDFNDKIEGYWLNPVLWANPLQDWQLKDDKVYCEVIGESREIAILNREITEETGRIEVQYDFNFIEKDNESLKKEESFVGFSIGKKNWFKDYRAYAVMGEGLKAGLSLSGFLFIDNEKKKVKLKKDKLYRLHLSIDKTEKQTLVNLKLFSGKRLIHKIEQKIKQETAEGLIDIVAHFEKANMPQEGERTRSVWIDNLVVNSSENYYFPNRTLGPIVFSKYLVQADKLKLSVQFVPRVNFEEKVFLDIQNKGTWKNVSETTISENNLNALFEIPYTKKEETNYRVRYTSEGVEYLNEGNIKPYASTKDSIIIGGLSCIYHRGFPHSPIIEGIKSNNPDILFFAGDQIYETGLKYGIADHRFPEAVSRLDYLYKWYQFGWAFRDLLQNYPSIIITDDHDVFQPNLWGALGQNIENKKKEAKYGGYLMSKEFVNFAESTQVNHLPKTKGKTVNGIDTYYTNYKFRGIDFAILEDRKFKSPPPKYKYRPVIEDAKNYQLIKKMAKDLENENAVLLGKQQTKFLNNWAENWDTNTVFKVVLSQTPLAQIHNDHKQYIPPQNVYPESTYAWDFDTNAWPQNKRNSIIEIFKKCAAFHICGDQHLGMNMQYGIHNWKDAGFAISIPAASNGYARAWYPPDVDKTKAVNQRPLGDFKDSFNNFLTVDAVFNPKEYAYQPKKLHDKAPGYAIITFFKQTQLIKTAVYRRGASLNAKKENKPVEGWDITINRNDNFGTSAKYTLPVLLLFEQSKCLMKVTDESGNLIHSFIPHHQIIQLKMDKTGTYKIEFFGNNGFYEFYELEAVAGNNYDTIEVGKK